MICDLIQSLEAIIRLDHEWNVMFHHRIEIFVGYMWLIGFLMLNASFVLMVRGRDTLEPFPRVDCYYLRKNSMCLGEICH